MDNLLQLPVEFIEDSAKVLPDFQEFLKTDVSSCFKTSENVNDFPQNLLAAFWKSKGLEDHLVSSLGKVFFGYSNDDKPLSIGDGWLYKISAGTVIPNLVHVLTDDARTVGNRFSNKEHFKKDMAEWGSYFGYCQPLETFLIDTDHPHFSIFRKKRFVFSDKSFTPILVSSDLNDRCFTHWIMGRLNDFYQLKNLLSKIKKPLLVFTYKPLKWQIDSLNYFFNLHNCTYAVVENPTLFTQLIIASGVRNHWFYSDFLSHLYRVGFESQFYSNKNVQLPKRIFISRRDAAGRQIINESQVVGLLRSFGFTVIEMADLAFSDQVSVIRSAEIIIFVTGSSGMNLIHARTGTKVGIISPNSISNRGTWAEVCANFGIGTVDLIDANLSVPSSTNSDMIVNLESLKEILMKWELD